MKSARHIIALAILLGAHCISQNTYSQACPACSNPALQSSEKLEAGADTLYKGTFRVTFNATNGFNYQGGHPEHTQLTSDGILIEGDIHEHTVDLDFLRSEFSLEYTFKDNWTGWLRLPYDIKAQTANVDFVSEFTQQEQADIVRNRDIHHRNETYKGLSDFRFLVAHRFTNFLGEKSRLDVAFGTTLPIGKTEQNPIAAGIIGEKHLHIQFGTGTFDPLLELHYVTSFSKQISFALFSMNKISLYENDENMYKGPFETTNGFSFGWRAKKWIVLRATFANFSQTQALWDGNPDPNSGLISFNSSVAATIKFKSGFTLTPGYRFPIYQQTLSEEGDVFDYGPTFILNISRAFSTVKQKQPLVKPVPIK